MRPLTDSLHNNRNAFLVGQYDNVLFWDQELNSTTTQLCYRDLSQEPNEVKVLLVQAGVKLTHPKVLDLGQSSTLADLKIFYQTNEGKDIDLKYVTLKADGSISDPEIVSTFPGNDVNLTIDDSGLLAWENSGKIWVSHYLYQSNSFSTPFAVDTIDSYAPVISSQNFLNYLKHNADSTDVITINMYFDQVKWEFGDTIIRSFPGVYSNFTTNNKFAGMNLCMQGKTETGLDGLTVFDRTYNRADYLTSPSFNLSQPAISDFMIAVKKANQTSNMYFLAYVSDLLAQNEVFIQTPMNYETQNISQWAGDDRNPQLFVTFPWPYIRYSLIWESVREGFSTLYSSHFDYLFSSLSENVETESISANPCPFIRETTIRVHASGASKVRIIDMQGHTIAMLLAQMDADGWQKTVWDGTNMNGTQVPSGTYIIVSTAKNETQKRIIIKQ